MRPWVCSGSLCGGSLSPTPRTVRYSPEWDWGTPMRLMQVAAGGARSGPMLCPSSPARWTPHAAGLRFSLSFRGPETCFRRRRRMLASGCPAGVHAPILVTPQGSPGGVCVCESDLEEYGVGECSEVPPRAAILHV